MSGPLQIDGAWPGRVTLRKGWFKATARPWNETTPDAAIRMERGTASFLTDASEWVHDHVAGSVYSPALYRSATRVWVRASYEPFVDLAVMEHRLIDLPDRPDRVSLSATPDLAALELVDSAAFDDFWHMGVPGLEEAMAATPRSAVLEAHGEHEIAGYAIVGVQMGISYLQRIATHPRYQGLGLGKDLLLAACHWGKAAGSANMVLNVKPDNEGAVNLYTKMGFIESGNHLQVLRYAR